MKNQHPALLLFSFLVITAAAQTPVFVPINGAPKSPSQTENECNFAGTLEVGQFIGQSSDTDLSTIYLCFGDSILIRHLGDADLSGDPNPTTPPGIVYGFYSCAPQITGQSLQEILSDPCLLDGSISGLFVTPGVQNGGETWFFNSGAIQNGFNLGKPTRVFFAPMTIDDYAFTSYESAQVGAEPGPCVDVNTEAIFDVVYLNQIRATGVNNAFGNDCLGRFTVLGGYPQFEPNATYSINIELTTDPSVKAQVLTAQSNQFDLSSILFSVSQAGVYTVSIEDGKSCGALFQMDMSGCDASDNLVLQFDEVAGTPGMEVCVPLRVKNFDIVSGSFSINWDPELLKLKDLINPHAAIANFFDLDSNTTIALAGTGKFGVILFDSWNPGNAITIPDDEVLFELCFEVLDTTDQPCIPVFFNNTPSQISMEDIFGQGMGITFIPGGVCKSVDTEQPEIEFQSALFPNPCKSGESAWLNLHSGQNVALQYALSDITGKPLLLQKLEFLAGTQELKLPTENLLPGVYFATISSDTGEKTSFKLLVY